MEKVTTASGKVYECDYFNPSTMTAQLNLRVIGVSIVDVASVFSDPSETKQLFYEGQYTHNFTKLIAIIPEGIAIRVVLGEE